MGSIITLLSGFLLTASIMTVFIIIYSFRKRTPISKTFSMLCITIAIYSIGYAMELYSDTFSQMLFWNLIQYIGIPFINAFWIILALQYTNREVYLRPAFKLSIFVIPFITIVLRYTNNLHHLMYANVTYDTSKIFPVLFIEKGPWYIANAFFILCCIVSTSYLYLLQYKKSSGMIHKQCLIMLIGSIIPWLTYLMDLLNIAPFGIDYGPFAASFSCFLFLIALFRFQLLNLKPLARDKVFDCTNDGIIVLDAHNNIIDFNPSASEIIPCLGSDAISKNIQTILEGADSIIESIFTSAETQYEVVRDGIKSCYTVRTSKMNSENGNTIGTIVTVTDITRYVKMMEQLDQLAKKDDLTGVFNRRYFFERSSYELEKSQLSRCALSFIILDLDFFKNVNDNYGHQAGDFVLAAVSKICCQSIRSTDILGRFGGEEFVIILPETGPDEAIAVANRIRSNIEASEIACNGISIKVTASFGVTGINSVGNETLNYFMKSSDKALYKAKRAGRNCVRAEYLHSNRSA